MFRTRLSNAALAELLTVLVAILLAPCAVAQQSDADLAAAAQNPVAATYSLPFQNNVFGGAGPGHNAVGNVLNIQPVLPFTFGDWNVISRTIAPLIYVPGLVPGLPDNAGVPAGTNSVFGLGDINQTFYISPAASRGLIWGIGPSITLPTATSSEIGSGKLSAGPGAVALVMPKPWVIGILGRQLWSVAGPQQPQGRKPAAVAALRELQPARRLVSRQLADRYGRLDGNLGEPLERSRGRRHRQDIPHRLAAYERVVTGLRLPDPHQFRTILGGQVPVAVSVPTLKADVANVTSAGRRMSRWHSWETFPFTNNRNPRQGRLTAYLNRRRKHGWIIQCSSQNDGDAVCWIAIHNP
jgi:hypothetical protein